MRFLAQGLPSTDLEDWQYTDLAPLAALPVEALQPDAQIEETRTPNSPTALGCLQPRFLRRWHRSDHRREQRRRSAAASDDRPHQRHRLVLERNSEATLILNTSGDARSRRSSPTSTVQAGRAPAPDPRERCRPRGASPDPRQPAHRARCDGGRRQRGPRRQAVASRPATSICSSPARRCTCTASMHRPIVAMSTTTPASNIARRIAPAASTSAASPATRRGRCSTA